MKRQIEVGYWAIEAPEPIQREVSLSTKNFCEIALILSDLDDMTLLSGDSELRRGPVRSGRFRVSQPNTAFCVSVAANAPVKVLKVFFTETTARAIAAEIKDHSIDIEVEDPLFGADDVLLAMLGNEIVENINDPRPANRAFAEEAAILMAARAISHYTTARHFACPPARIRGLEPNLDGALQLMHDHIGGAIDLDMLSQSVGLSIFSFTRAFKKKYGLSPMQHHRRLRLDRAKFLLLRTSYQVSRISEMLGFAEPSHFVSAFKKATGVTPLAFRRTPRRFET